MSWMFESINIISNKAIVELTQSLRDYDVNSVIATEIIYISEESLKNSGDLQDKYATFLDKSVTKYIFQFSKKSFDNKNTVKIYHEISVLLKKLKNSGCDADVFETDELVCVAAIVGPVNIDNL